MVLPPSQLERGNEIMTTPRICWGAVMATLFSFFSILNPCSHYLAMPLLLHSPQHPPLQIQNHPPPVNPKSNPNTTQKPNPPNTQISPPPTHYPLHKRTSKIPTFPLSPPYPKYLHTKQPPKMGGGKKKNLIESVESYTTPNHTSANFPLSPPPYSKRRGRL